jgi:hypothetical protein
MHQQLRGYEKVKAQKLLSLIESGEFDENDVEGLFMKLRAYCGNRRLFREIADFVAHNDIRDKGLTNESMEAFYLSIKFFCEYVSVNKALNLGEPFPLYIKRLMKYQAMKADAKTLLKQFRVSPGSLVKKIRTHFKDDEQAGTAQLNGTLGVETAGAIQYVLGFIDARPAFTQDGLMQELLLVLAENKLTYDRQKLAQQADRISLCILALLHDTRFDFNGHKLGNCAIAADSLAISHGVTYLDEHGKEVPNPESFGHLQLHGHVAAQYNGGDVQVAYTVFQTSLDALSWCDDSLFAIEYSTAGEQMFAWRKLDTSGAIGISEAFKLVRVAAE